MWTNQLDGAVRAHSNARTMPFARARAVGHVEQRRRAHQNSGTIVTWLARVCDNGRVNIIGRSCVSMAMRSDLVQLELSTIRVLTVESSAIVECLDAGSRGARIAKQRLGQEVKMIIVIMTNDRPSDSTRQMGSQLFINPN